VAWWCGLESQQATWPQVRHIRRCAQTLTPSTRQSAQPSVLSGSGAVQAASSNSVVCAQLIVLNHGPPEIAVPPHPTGHVL
jgi:hypothetical protein